MLAAPADIEGHLGKDGRYYVVDTARYEYLPGKLSFSIVLSLSSIDDFFLRSLSL